MRTPLRRLVSYPDEVQDVIARDLAGWVARAGRPLRILDVGCGTTSMLATFQATDAGARCHLIGLDAHGPTIAWGRAHGFHHEYVHGDVRDPGALPSVDIVVATDLVEHLEKSEAAAVITEFDRKAALAVILLTPNGYRFNPYSAENPFMEHKCGFTVDELGRMGYACRGLGGAKWMRGDGSRPRGPKILYLPLLALLSRGMRRLPRWSFHLLATKSRAAANGRAREGR